MSHRGGMHCNCAERPTRIALHLKPHLNRVLHTVPAEARQHVRVHEGLEVRHSSGTTREITNILEAGIKIKAGATLRTVCARCGAVRIAAWWLALPAQPHHYDCY